MAHYFDDVFHRNVGIGNPKVQKPRMRRSSTGRSIGARSDFDTSVNGDDDDGSIGNSVANLDPERESQRHEADAHMHRYITDQLERVKTDDEEDDRYNLEDEVEATAS
jgi:hypothetical protein